MNFDGKYAYDLTASLSYPRLIGSDGDKRARDEIEAEMKKLGLETTREDFDASTFPMGVLARWVMAVVAAPMFLGALAYTGGHPLIGLLFGAVTLAVAWQAMKVANDFEKFFKYGEQIHTQNITGRLKGGGDKGHVVLMAHFDTKSQPFPIEFRILAYLVGALGVVVGTAWLVIASIGALAGLWAAGGSALFIVALIGTAVSASLIFNRVENKSVGSLDNAAGVAVIMGLAKAWTAQPVDGISLTVVATSAEEAGLQGAEQWMYMHEAQLDKNKTVFLNYDGPGSKTGDIIVTSTFGLPRRDISGPELKEDFLAACRELDIKNARDVYIPFGASTDMMPVSKRGFRVLNIGSLTRGVHTTRDNMSIIDQGELQKAGDIGVKVIERYTSRCK